MRKTLTEMDYDYGLEQAKEQGAAENQKSIVQKMIQNGQSHAQVIDFLEQIIGMDPEKAEEYYRELTE